jgi:hypothetical protein
MIRPEERRRKMRVGGGRAREPREEEGTARGRDTQVLETGQIFYLRREEGPFHLGRPATDRTAEVHEATWKA